MKFQRLLPVLLTACIFTFSFSGEKQKSDWTSLFNKKDFTGWDKYIGPDLDSTGKMINNKPVGLNNDPKHVFTVIKENGENIIRISGEGWGAISTQKEYENYHFQLKFKWGNLTWGQKKNKKKDSGLLYHSVGPYGADYGAWMRSQEFQIEEGNCGEYWGVAGGMEDIPAIQNADSDYVYNPAGKVLTFSAASPNGRHCRKAIDAENPSEEWNTLDLYCYGDTSVHVINDKVIMILYHSKQMENRQAIPLTKGKLQIQSEGAEVFYKELKIQALAKLPPKFLK
jgi:hypothetical protein